MNYEAGVVGTRYHNIVLHAIVYKGDSFPFKKKKRNNTQGTNISISFTQHIQSLGL